MLFESLKYDFVRSFLQQLLTQDKYKKINASDDFEDYYLEGKYAFYLGIDALCKYEIIVGDITYLADYVEQLSRIFKKFNDADDIRTGVYSLIGRIVSVQLSINNFNSCDAREKILHHIYNKYIVNGYFYFGFSSNYLNEISCIGIRHDSFSLDNRLREINDILRKFSKHTLFSYQNISITDNIIIALYHSFISPSYLSDMIESPFLQNKKFDKECFYTKDIVKIKDILLTLTDDLRINHTEKQKVINNFVDVFGDTNQSDSYPCIAKIKRESIGKNKLKDIESIIKNKDNSLTECIGLIVDSRYISFDLHRDLDFDSIEIIKIPSYKNFLIGKNNFISLPSTPAFDKEELKVSDSFVTNNITVNSYGAVSVAIIGVLFIIVGVVMTIILRMMGG